VKCSQLGQSEEEATEVTEERVWQAFAAFMHQQGGSITQSEVRPKSSQAPWADVLTPPPPTCDV
jgi:hypothetical protein